MVVYLLILQKKKKEATINPKNEDYKCFQYVATVALNYEEINWNLERVPNIKLFINRYNWEKINYPSNIGDWKTFGKSNPTIALNFFYTKEKEIFPAYILYFILYFILFYSL